MKKKSFALLAIVTFTLIYGKLAYIIYNEDDFNSCFSLAIGVPSGSDCCECPKIQAIFEAILFSFIATFLIFFMGWGFVALNLFYYVLEVPPSTNKIKGNKRAKIFSLIVYLSIIPLIIFFLSLVIFDNPNYIVNPVPLEDVEPTFGYYLVWILYSPFPYIYLSYFVLFRKNINNAKKRGKK